MAKLNKFEKPLLILAGHRAFTYPKFGEVSPTIKNLLTFVQFSIEQAYWALRKFKRLSCVATTSMTMVGTEQKICGKTNAP